MFLIFRWMKGKRAWDAEQDTCFPMRHWSVTRRFFLPQSLTAGGGGPPDLKDAERRSKGNKKETPSYGVSSLTKDREGANVCRATLLQGVEAGKSSPDFQTLSRKFQTSSGTC